MRQCRVARCGPGCGRSDSRCLRAVTDLVAWRRPGMDSALIPCAEDGDAVKSEDNQSRKSLPVSVSPAHGADEALSLDPYRAAQPSAGGSGGCL